MRTGNEAWRQTQLGVYGDLLERQYTHSKVSAQIAFDRAIRLARQGQLPIEEAARWVRAPSRKG